MAMIGEIKLFGGSKIPDGWFECNGQQIDAWNYGGLHQILGDKYGPWDFDNFSLPKIDPLPDSDGVGQSVYIINATGEWPYK